LLHYSSIEVYSFEGKRNKFLFYF